MKNKPSIYRTALPLYFTYFIHGIGVSILSQYKSALQTAWGAADISAVIQVIAALGLGRLVALPISGYVSDRRGRKTSGLWGVFLYALYFFGIAYAPSAKAAYAAAIIGGIMPLLSGLAMTTAVRDTVYGDLVSGMARALEAMLLATAVAIGVYTGLKMAAMMGGIAL